MRKPRLAWFISILMLSLLALAGEDNWQEIHFREVDTLFANPGQGWMSQRFPSSVVYLRFDWAEVEPQEGRYNWQRIDDTIADCKSRGAAVAMRVMTANAHSKGYYSSPQWLFDLGCKGFEYTVGGNDPTSGGRRISRIEPDYADPIYLAKHAAFIAALGKRYAGNPNVEFLDIGSYGIWGEWHTPHPALLAVREKIIEMYRQAFPKTALVGMVDDGEALAYTLKRGGGYRCDGIGSPKIQNRWTPGAADNHPFYPPATLLAINEAWKNAPVVFEWYGDYDFLNSKGWSFDAAVDFMLRNHVTLINDNIGLVPAKAMPQLQKLARLAGYRFVLRELALKKSVLRGEVLDVKMKWANVGVGKLYDDFELQLSLRNSVGQTVVTTIADTDPRKWLPGEYDVAAQIPIPIILPIGEYTLAVALMDKSASRRPLNLAMAAPAKAGWYQVGILSVE